MPEPIKVLYLLLDHHIVKRASVACQDTWLTTIGDHAKVVFIGDALMPDRLGQWEVYKPILKEPKKNRASITEKMCKSFKHILGIPDWDYVVRIDVDAYCNVKNLHKFLQSLNKDDQLYAGQGIHKLSSRGKASYLSGVKSVLPPKEFSFYYAQGGCYIMSRKTVETLQPRMYHPAPGKGWAEDIMIGDVAAKSGVPLTDRPDLFCCGYHGVGWNVPGSGGIKGLKAKNHVAMMCGNYISTHKCTPDVLYLIHRSRGYKVHIPSKPSKPQTHFQPLPSVTTRFLPISSILNDS